MAYRPLDLPSSLSPRLRDVYAQLEDHYFRDLHCMFRLPLPGSRIASGCNFAIAQSLLAVVSGISTTLYRSGNKSGERFKNLLIDRYPWNREPGSKVTPTKAADTLYSVFRNPLTHDLGLDVENKATTKAVKIKRFALDNGRRGLTEYKIARLESPNIRPTMSPTIVIRRDATVLLVDALYWGTRVMLEDLARDTICMKAADNFLSTL